MNHAIIEVWDCERILATIHTNEDGVAVVSRGLTAIHCAYNPPETITIILRPPA